MRFFILAAAFTLANIVSASTPSSLPALRDLTVPQSDVVQSVDFPVTARSTQGRRRSPSLGPTNGELMQRGARPASRPRRLYEARSLAKRQADAVPAQASSTSSPIYQFLQCADTVFGTQYTQTYTFPYTDIQDLANHFGNCLTGVDSPPSVTCTAATFAFYSSAV